MGIIVYGIIKTKFIILDGFTSNILIMEESYGKFRAQRFCGL